MRGNGMSKTKEIIELLEKGYAHYGGYVDEAVYTERKCHNPKKADWFCRPWSEEHKTSRYICLGCYKRCSLIDPKGFQLLLPVSRQKATQVGIFTAYKLSVDELLRSKRVLRVDEAAWALSVSKMTVYKWVDEGRLEAVPGPPLRVTSASVARNLEPAV